MLFRSINVCEFFLNHMIARLLFIFKTDGKKLRKPKGNHREATGLPMITLLCKTRIGIIACPRALPAGLIQGEQPVIGMGVSGLHLGAE